MSKWGEYFGEVRTQWLTHEGADREMELLEGFQFRDEHGKIWPAEKGHRIDGASIPQIFWSDFPGPPFVGEYRRAAALHDSLYIVKYENDRKSVDRVLYKSMRADNTA
jgi:hypothetical protein